MSDLDLVLTVQMEYFNFDVYLKEMKICFELLLVFIGVHKHKSAKEVVHARFAIPSGCTRGLRYSSI